MAHHLIYIPRGYTGNAAAAHPLEAVGLADHVAGAESIPIGHGPDGDTGAAETPSPAGGLLFAWRDSGANKRLHYHAGEQTWFPAAARGERAAGRYWVGIWNDAPPCEADLRRGGILHGQDVALGAGQWHVPAPTFLPHDLVLNERGEIERQPKACYQSIALEAERWRGRLSGEPRMIAYDELWDFGMRCLSLNYKLPPELASHLRLIDEENIKRVMYAAVGIDLAGLDAGGDDAG